MVSIAADSLGRSGRRLEAAVSNKAGRVPVPIILLVLSFLCPTEFSAYLGDLRLPPHRIVLILFFPLALYRIATRRDTRFRAFDACFFLYAAWTVGIYTYHSGQEGMVYGGSLALESLGGYLIARAWIRDWGTFQATLNLLAVAIFTAAVFAVLDSIYGNYFIHNALRTFIGGDPMPPVDIRMGLVRAASVFDHPIHYGTFCAALFALFWFSETRTTRRLQRACLLGVATMLGLSSAPLLCIGLQIAMIAWEYVTRGFALRTHITLAILTGLYLGASFVTSRPPLYILITSATFDPWTGFYRILIWEHGLNNVWASPWTGLGLADWERPQWMVSSTMDAFWLVTTMRSGIPAFLILALAIVLIGRAVLKRGVRSRDRALRRLASGWMISLIAFCTIGATVHYWNVLHAFFFFFLGLAGWIADPKRTASRQTRAAPPPYGPYQHAVETGYGPAFSGVKF